MVIQTEGHMGDEQRGVDIKITNWAPEWALGAIPKSPSRPLSFTGTVAGTFTPGPGFAEFMDELESGSREIQRMVEEAARKIARRSEAMLTRFLEITGASEDTHRFYALNNGPIDRIDFSDPSDIRDNRTVYAVPRSVESVELTHRFLARFPHVNLAAGEVGFGEGETEADV